MEYKRLKFSQYFIDTSNDYNQTGKSRRKISYQQLHYQCNSLEGAFHMHHEMNYDVYYDAERDVIQINFEDSNGLSDWYANIAEFSDKYYDSIVFEGKKLQLRVHHGWGEMYKSIKHILRREWSALHQEHPTAHTEIIGWSLGSGQAVLCAQDLNYNYGIRPYLYTFGSVRPFRHTFFNKERMLRYLSSICTKCYNFGNVNDIVSYMPCFYGFTNINSVRVGLERRSIRRLLNPRRYHTIYDTPAFYTEANIRANNKIAD
ncbi:MAG: hypothetical protein MJ071_08855 [Oscillospiraceae bacterium]|nr:hypothetical protein [Oscillospiraceae bacterium]